MIYSLRVNKGLGADMLKIIKDKGSDYFRPDEAVTHYTFEIN